MMFAIFFFRHAATIRLSLLPAARYDVTAPVSATHTPDDDA